VNGERSPAHRIREAGWRQGAVLHERDGAELRQRIGKEGMPEPAESDWWIVITHDCDLINRDLGKESTVGETSGSPWPRLLAAGLARRDLRLVGMALDLAVPPLALLALLMGAALAGTGCFALLAGRILPLQLSAAALAMLAAAVLLAWARYGRRVISLAWLAYAPFSALRKVPIYLAFLTRRQVEWVRTRREE
jgi:hypothetical protein